MKNQMRKLNHPVSPEILAQIGDITVSFALLESSMQQLTWSLIREHQRIGQIITSELSFQNLRSLTISLFLERHGEDEDGAKLKELMREASEIEEKRNQITHSIWATGNTSKTINRVKMTAKQKHGYRIVFEEYNEEKLENLANDIKILAYEIQVFHIGLIKNGKAVNNPFEKMW